MFCAVFHHSLDGVRRSGSLHHSLMPAAIVEFYGKPIRLNLLPHIIACIEDAAGAVFPRNAMSWFRPHVPQ